MTTDRVVLGLCVWSLADVADGDTLREAGIRTVVRLTHTPPEDGYPDGVAVPSHPMTDGPRNDFEAFAAAALAVREGIGLREAFRRVDEARTAADPHSALVRRATRFLAER